jgi:hypothetical protein
MQESDDELRKYLEELHKIEVEKENLQIAERERQDQIDKKLLKEKTETAIKSFERFKIAVEKMCNMVPATDTLKIVFKESSDIKPDDRSGRRTDEVRVSYRGSAKAEIEYWRIYKDSPAVMKWSRSVGDSLQDWKCLADGRWEPLKGGAGEYPETVAKKFVTMVMQLPAH